MMNSDPMTELEARMREQQAYDEMNAAWDKEERASGAPMIQSITAAMRAVCSPAGLAEIEARLRSTNDIVETMPL